eukprot:8543438-Pyramimonas_sp.AAC.1
MMVVLITALDVATILMVVATNAIGPTGIRDNAHNVDGGGDGTLDGDGGGWVSCEARREYKGHVESH